MHAYLWQLVLHLEVSQSHHDYSWETGAATACLNFQDCLQVGEEANARALEGLLSPNGKLFRAMHSADADGLIKFIFPLERLPTHTQLLLASEAGRCLSKALLLCTCYTCAVLQFRVSCMCLSSELEYYNIEHCNTVQEGAGTVAAV